ncbi:MAG: YkgJ family cysteine cluster protein [Bacteroidia bacterium]
MTIAEKARAVERLYKQLDKEIAAFQAASGMTCIAGCGHCCQTSDVSACPLEFIPLAYHAYKQGRALEWWEALVHEPEGLCPQLRPLIGPSDLGFCGGYTHRGLICRLFGYASLRNKYGEQQLYTCKLLKTERAETYQATLAKIRQGLRVPIVSDYYQRLRDIDPALAETMLPIRAAVREALAVVLQYYAYRPRRLRKAA